MFLKSYLVKAKVHSRYFDDPPADTILAGNANDPPSNDPPGDDDKPKFSQKDLGKAVAKERDASKKQTEAAIKQLEEVKKQKGLSDQAKEDLQKRIEDLQTSMLSKEEFAKKEKEKLENKYKTDLEEVGKKAKNWEGRFSQERIRNTILTEATKAEAYDSDQMIEVLEPKTKLVEDLDGDGNGLGTFTPKVVLASTDKDGKDITLTLSVGEALKTMKDMQRYLNMFKPNITGGLGGSREGPRRGGQKRPEDMTHEEFRVWRKAGYPGL